MNYIQNKVGHPLHRSIEQEKELKEYTCCAGCWKFMTVFTLILHLVLTFYWFQSLGYDVFKSYFYFNLVISIPSIIFLIKPDWRSNCLLEIVSYLVVLVVIGYLGYNLYLIVTLSPEFLEAGLWIFYSGLTSTLLQLCYVMAI